MNDDDIIRMAWESGLWVDKDGNITGGNHMSLLPFADLIAEAEREACCAIIYGQCGSDNVARRIVDAIQKRGA
jgi:hypothetical protein